MQPALRIASPPLQSEYTHAIWRLVCPAIAILLFLIIGALAVAVGVLGYNLYEAKKEPKGVQINVGPDGLKIQTANRPQSRRSHA